MGRLHLDTIKKDFKSFSIIKNIGWFVILFLFFEFIWKVCVHQGEDESILLVLGKNLTPYVYGLCAWTANATHFVIHSILGYENFKVDGLYIYFSDSTFKNHIVWGCTGLKQLIMFTFIMVCYFGPLRKKLWFIPASLVFLVLINIVRITVISFIVRDPFPEWFIGANEWYNGRTWDNSEASFTQFYQDWFNVFHHDIFTWIYYDGIIFLLWLFWEERFNKPYQKLKNKIAAKSN
jgi:exosortase/archaeosortase family protein